MNSSGGESRSQGPLGQLLELLARRNTVPVLRFLHGGPQPFGAIASHLDAPASQLTQRLKDLRQHGLVEVDETGDYRLTNLGRRLEDPLDGMRIIAEQVQHLTPRQRHPRGAATRGRGEPEAYR